jgi:hypothetical protein
LEGGECTVADLVNIKTAASVGIGSVEGGLQLHQLVQVDAILHRGAGIAHRVREVSKRKASAHG